jgi:hypothetical protein
LTHTLGHQIHAHPRAARRRQFVQPPHSRAAQPHARSCDHQLHARAAPPPNTAATINAFNRARRAALALPLIGSLHK